MEKTSLLDFGEVIVKLKQKDGSEIVICHLTQEDINYLQTTHSFRIRKRSDLNEKEESILKGKNWWRKLWKS